MIDPDTIKRLADQANWYFDVQLGDLGDSLVSTGDGVDDLDTLLKRMDGNPRLTLKLDVGLGTSSWEDATRADVVALRAAYVSAWGATPKPPFWDTPR